MKKLLYLIVFTLLLSSCNNKELDLNVMTFNIRMDTSADSLNSWKYRKDAAAEIVKVYDVDLLGTQEVLHHQLNDLKERLPEYNAVGVGREDGKTKGEYSAIFYKKDKFAEMSSGTFWLSETPETAGSKGWDGACERVATWAVLKDKQTGKSFFYINTHLDHVGKTARREGVNLIIERAKELGKGLPVIITGDFNASPESEVIKQVTGSGIYNDSKEIAANVKADAKGTFHDFGRVPEERRSYIDYIFVNDKISVDLYEALPEKMNDVFLSDHIPVFAKLTVK